MKENLTIKQDLLIQKIRRQLKTIQDKSDLNAFITVLEKQSIPRVEEIHKIDSELPLWGYTLAVKDNICLEDVPLTCASQILNGYVSPYTATALARLIAAGAIVLGKTNLDEFAMGSSNENSSYGAVLNPYDKKRVPGGSSGGSAVAVAADLVDAALGSDTGGSVRQPAAFCGIIGLKPTYGRVSRYGLTAFASSLDQIGVLAKRTEQVASIFQVMAGNDSKDNTTSIESVPNYLNDMDLNFKGLRIGIPKEYIGEGIQPEITASMEDLKEQLVKKGAIIKVCTLPHTKYAIPTYCIIASAECSSNLARYDGVRYGMRARQEDNMDIIGLTRQNGFGREVKRRILIGTYVLSAGYYDAYYKKAQRVRRLIRGDFVNVFNEVDILLTPTTPTTAFKIGEKVKDPISMYLSDIFTAPASLAGIPAISVPYGFDEKGLPIGMQFMANYYREDILLQISNFMEDISRERNNG